MKTEEVVLCAKTKEQALFRMYYSSAEPGRREYIEHHHTEVELSYILCGSCEWQIRKRPFVCGQGDIVLLGSDEEHYITGIEECEPLKLLNLRFEPRFIWSPGNDLFDPRYLGIFLHHGGDFENRLPAGDAAAGFVARLMLEMYQECAAAKPEYELIVKAELLMILGLLGRKFADFVHASTPTSAEHLRRLDEALTYINENLASHLTLTKIARAAGMSNSYFSTIFKAMNGVSVWDYVTGKRVELAKKYIRENEKSITEISGLCGFNTIANFNRSFKMVTHCTPSGYRKTWMED